MPENKESSKNKEKNEKIGQEQFHYFVFSEDLSWQEIVYDLINSEQLDPWDINLSLLAQKYLDKIKELEEANFVLSSKVILIASLLLRIKSELLMNRYMRDLDDILFNKKTDIQDTLKTIEFDDEDIPPLIPRTPLPRFKKVSLQELMTALSKAVETETRRVERKRTERENYEKTKFFMPKKTINLIERIKNVHVRIKTLFQTEDRVKFDEFAGPKKEERINTFIPLLHLDTQNHLWLQQNSHLDDIWIHKSGDQFIQRDEIITDSIEREFENQIETQEEIEKGEKLFDLNEIEKDEVENN